MATTKKSVQQAPEKVGVMDYAADAVNETIDYCKKDVGPLFTDMLKIEILSVLVMLIGFGIVTALVLIPMISVSGDYQISPAKAIAALFSTTNIIMLAVAFVIGVITLIVGTAISSTKNNAIDLRKRGKQISIMSQITQNLIPMIKYMVVMGILTLVIFSPLILLFLSNNMALAMASLMLIFVSVFVWMIIAFLIQFTMWELLVNRKGIIDSLKTSFNLVKENPGKTIIFDIFFVIGAIIIGIAFAMVNFIVQVICSVLTLIIPFVGSMLYLVCILFISIIEGAVFGVTLMLFGYLFWKKLQK